MNHRIGMDIRMIQRTGIGTYVRGLLSGWHQAGLADELGLALYGKSAPSPDWSRHPAVPFHSDIYSVQEQFEYPWRLKNCRLWHAPHYNVPVVKGRTRLVVTIHDLIHWIFRKEFLSPLQESYAGFMLRRAVENADHVITVSEKTKNDLVTHFDAPAEKISVIYEGVDARFKVLDEPREIDRVLKKYGVPPQYFIYIGMLKPHKNVQWLIHLFRRLREEGRLRASLVLVGRKDKKYPKGYEDLLHLKTTDEIIHIPYVEDDELVALYNGALALAHPSLYEGFGLTLLEAMACGTPVIACRSASVPEVAGDAACLVDSCDEKEMTDALVRMESFPNLRDEFQRKGYRRSREFRWDEAARRTAEVYERVLNQ